MYAKKKYRLLIGAEGVFHISLPVICTVLVLFVSDPGAYQSIHSWFGVLFSISFYLILIALHLTLSSVVVFDFSIHVVFLGFTIREIALNQIQNVELTEYGFGYMALSKEKIKITGHNDQKTLISLRNASDFLAQIGFDSTQGRPME